MSTWCWVISPIKRFCSFWSVAVNTRDKLQHRHEMSRESEAPHQFTAKEKTQAVQEPRSILTYFRNHCRFDHTHTHTHTRLTTLLLELTKWAGTRKVKPIWILLKQETVSGSGICSWAICKSAPRFRQITTPAPHHSSFFTDQML